MKEVRSPGLIEPLIVRVAPYITTMITDSVDAAFRLPKNRPTAFCTRNTRYYNESCYSTRLILYKITIQIIRQRENILITQLLKMLKQYVPLLHMFSLFYLSAISFAYIKSLLYYDMHLRIYGWKTSIGKHTACLRPSCNVSSTFSE